MNPKISADHLKRRAIVYIRQSSPSQVIHNRESQRRQYGLADHARQLGFIAKFWSPRLQQLGSRQ
jgi:hypothetical protein